MGHTTPAKPDDQTTGGRGRGQKRGQIARARMLDAGLAVFADLSLDDLLSEVGPRRVIRELGDVSAGAFYHHFRDRQAYLNALVDHALGPRGDHVAPETVALLRELVEAPDPDVVEMIESACRADFEREASVGLLALRFQLTVWATHENPEVRDTLRGYYARFSAQYVAAYEQLLERWGREFRPPFTSHSAAAALTALLEGLVVRACIDPSAADAELFSNTVLAILPVLTRAEGDSQSLTEAIATIRGFPRPAAAAPNDGELRARVLDAALAFADAGTFEDASTEDIARDAGVDPEATHRRFGAKPGLAAATFARFLPLLERPLTRDLEEGRPPVDVIQGHLRRLADVATRHRGLTNALVEAVQTAAIRYGSRIGPSDPRAIVPLPQLLEPAVQAGQEQGVVRDDHEAFDLAATVTNIVLLRVVTCPNEPADRVAAFAGDVVLFGIVERAAGA